MEPDSAARIASGHANGGAGSIVGDRSAMGERWEVGDELGSGALARVVRVRDRMDGRVYAAKLLHPRHERDATAVARFRREAELASRLVHENLVRVWGTHVIAGHTALVMELVEGPTLAHRLAVGGPLDRDALMAVARGLASGLAYAHAHGVIHRDLKPANVLVAPSGPKIADFGMARASSFAEADRGALTVLGTPPYMAPECLDPLAVDPRTDLYALGCILHELGTGAPPFAGPTPFAMLEAHRTAPIPKLPESFGEPLRRLVASLMAKAAGDRPQSAGAVLAALAAIDDPDTVRALALPASTAPSAGCCAGCGSELSGDVQICFECGLVPVVIETGSNAVLVVGPGRVSDKLDSRLRERLVQWLAGNRQAGFEVKRLERKIPRLPFVLVRGLSERSAGTIAQSLSRLGLEAAITRSPMSHPMMSRHVRRMARRGFALSAAIAMAPAFIYPMFVIGMLPFVGIAAVASYTSAWVMGRRTSVVAMRSQQRALPPALATRLASLPDAVAVIEQRRHRVALGAVVRRVMGLVTVCDADTLRDGARELEHAINLATVAAKRMDDIERSMAQGLFDPADPEHRALMQERDTWAARLLDLTASLDALGARLAHAGNVTRLVRSEDALAPLRAQVEALEEVARP
jgi:hypothetical protein